MLLIKIEIGDNLLAICLSIEEFELIIGLLEKM